MQLQYELKIHLQLLALTLSGGWNHECISFWMCGTRKMSVVPCAPSQFWFIGPGVDSAWLQSSSQMGLDASLCGILLYNSVNGRGNFYLIDFELIVNSSWTGVTKKLRYTRAIFSNSVKEKDWKVRKSDLPCHFWEQVSSAWIWSQVTIKKLMLPLSTDNLSLSTIILSIYIMLYWH